MTEAHAPEPSEDEFELDDDALALAAGGIILSSNPSQTLNSTSGYAVNSTIYFQATIPGADVT
ncbi:MAG TPA: hypothetical protein VK139_04810 [Microbacteriaceae bacterium]|nr:hypothetical protein [Microbacteriaceae bacterium]